MKEVVALAAALLAGASSHASADALIDAVRAGNGHRGRPAHREGRGRERGRSARHHAFDVGGTLWRRRGCRSLDPSGGQGRGRERIRRDADVGSRFDRLGARDPRAALRRRESRFAESGRRNGIDARGAHGSTRRGRVVDRCRRRRQCQRTLGGADGVDVGGRAVAARDGEAAAGEWRGGKRALDRAAVEPQGEQ